MEHLQPRDKLSEKWPWNPEFLRLALIVPAVLGLSATAALYPTYGFHSFYFLLAVPVGWLLRLTFGAAGSRVEARRRTLEAGDGEVAEGLLVIGRVECPGLVVLRDTELMLVPIVGSDVTVPLATITSLRQGRWLPGKFVWGKRAFNLATPTLNRLAFAVSESIAEKWSPRLRPR